MTATSLCKIKLLKEESRRLSDKMVLMREKKRQQSHEIEILEDKVGQLKRTNKEMKKNCHSATPTR